MIDAFSPSSPASIAVALGCFQPEKVWPVTSSAPENRKNCLYSVSVRYLFRRTSVFDKTSGVSVYRTNRTSGILPREGVLVSKTSSDKFPDYDNLLGDSNTDDDVVHSKSKWRRKKLLNGSRVFNRLNIADAASSATKSHS